MTQQQPMTVPNMSATVTESQQQPLHPQGSTPVNPVLPQQSVLPQTGLSENVDWQNHNWPYKCSLVEFLG